MAAARSAIGTDAVVGWGLIAAWSGVTLASLYAPALISANTARYLNVALMSAFTLAHGSRRYGTGITAYFAIAVLVANLAENYSIATGFPFGLYHHTTALGPKFLQVPLIIGPIFAAAGYLGWTLAGILQGDVFAAGRAAIAKPLIAAFITTSWDFCVDPIGGTLNRDWVWANGGGYFGVPWLNYFGWMLTMWVIFQLFALYLARRAAPPAPITSAAYWYQPLVFWTLIALQFPLLYALVPDALVADPSGSVWRVSALLETMALASVFTMLFTVVLGYSLLRQRAQDI